MMIKPSISVIIPVWNRQDLIERCLDSILNQTLKPFEVIVVDNNSSDGTYESVERWIENHSDFGIDFKLLKEKKRGACEARQKGLENSNGDYLLFFDSDDEMHEDLLEVVVLKLKGATEADIVCWNCRLNLLDGVQRIPTIIREDLLESHLIHALLRPQGYLVRRDLLLKAGGWSKPLKVWNDYEVGLRLLMLDPKILFIEKILAEIYSQEVSITGKDFSSKESEWEKTLDEMNKEVAGSRHPQKKRIKRILDYRRAILAAHYYREKNFEGSKRLMDRLLPGKSLGERFLLIFSYYFTRHGLRGAWRLVRYFYGK